MSRALSPTSNQLTREAILEALPRIAHGDSRVAAAVYRLCVGLVWQGDKWLLDPTVWQRELPYYALTCSLTGREFGTSLLSSFPADFLPVALEMAEALYH
jgi:hypothetical protein